MEKRARNKQEEEEAEEEEKKERPERRDDRSIDQRMDDNFRSPHNILGEGWCDEDVQYFVASHVPGGLAWQILSQGDGTARCEVMRVLSLAATTAGVIIW